MILRGPVISTNMAMPDRVAKVVSSLETVKSRRATKSATVNGQMAKPTGKAKSSTIVGFLSSGPAKICFSRIDAICSSDRAIKQGIPARARITSMMGSISAGMNGRLNIFAIIEARVSSKNIAPGNSSILPLVIELVLLLASMARVVPPNSVLTSGVGSGALGGVTTASLLAGGVLGSCTGAGFGFGLIRPKPFGLSEEVNHWDDSVGESIFSSDAMRRSSIS